MCYSPDERRERRNNFIILGVITVTAIASVFVALHLIIESMRGTTDLMDYGKTLTAWSGSGLVDRFPASVPPQAKSVRFSAFPGMLQGGGHVQLRMQLSAEEITQLESRLKQTAIRTYAGGGFLDHYNKDQKNDVPTASFHTAEDPSNALEFPEHFTLYVLRAADRGGSWNHGETSGAAVSLTKNEVIYWAESW